MLKQILIHSVFITTTIIIVLVVLCIYLLRSGLCVGTKCRGSESDAVKPSPKTLREIFTLQDFLAGTATIRTLRLPGRDTKPLRANTITITGDCCGLRKQMDFFTLTSSDNSSGDIFITDIYTAPFFDPSLLLHRHLYVLPQDG